MDSVIRGIWFTASSVIGGNAVMVVFFTIGAVAGMLLGLRFKVLTLFPAIFIATAAIVISVHGLSIIVPTVVGTVVLLQVCYIGGCVLRAMVRSYISSRGSVHHRSASSKLAH
jgi:hypothetical protein